MLGGVAFFSYIMGNLLEIFKNYESKMGIVDRKGDLDHWIISLQRFTNRQPLPKSLQTKIEKDFNYFWANDRNSCYRDESFDLLPSSIKNEIGAKFLFADIFRQQRRFFDKETLEDYGLLSDISHGFVPRNFDPTADDDKIIYDEDMEIAEMYFI